MPAHIALFEQMTIHIFSAHTCVQLLCDIIVKLLHAAPKPQAFFYRFPQESGQEAAYSASSKAMLLTYWNIGKRIVEQELLVYERGD